MTKHCQDFSTTCVVIMDSIVLPQDPYNRFQFHSIRALINGRCRIYYTLATALPFGKRRPNRHMDATVSRPFKNMKLALTLFADRSIDLVWAMLEEDNDGRRVVTTAGLLNPWGFSSFLLAERPHNTCRKDNKQRF
jgi:hypothetical protein